MENVGAVTYSERYVFKDPPTEEKMSLFAMTILDELSHMWFGDLVTMNRWNDLWLNESFCNLYLSIHVYQGQQTGKISRCMDSFYKI